MPGSAAVEPHQLREHLQERTAELQHARQQAATHGSATQPSTSSSLQSLAETDAGGSPDMRNSAQQFPPEQNSDRGYESGCKDKADSSREGQPASDYGLVDGWHDVCGIATRLMGFSSAGEGSSGSQSSGPDTSPEDSYQILQQMLADLQDQSWLIHEDQLSVCLRTEQDGRQNDVRLGTGSFGAVYKGIMNKSVSVAIKAIKNPSMQAKIEFVNEMAMLMNLRHQNIVQCLGAVIDRKNLLLVMELMPRGDLYRIMQRDRDGALRWHKRGQTVILDIVRGVLHMHDLGIVHQDIKSGNVMMAKDFTAKIGDVGLAAVFDNGRTRTSNPGTIDWTAPEILQGACASLKADVFSLGIVLWEILTGLVPKRGSLRTLRAPQDCPEEVAEMVERCMDPDEKLRPTTHELFECLTNRSLPPGRALSAKTL